jgi:K+-sensing histidine kinase KdpD
MAEDESRPTPEVLLEEAKKEGRGRLKIFLGAYPGVGKSYAMLQAAQERRRAGVDVVIGVVETHGRAETEALLRGLWSRSSVLPPDSRAATARFLTPTARSSCRPSSRRASG